MRLLKELTIKEDELEALRLADVKGLDQVTAAGRMRISQSTFARILASARHKLAKAVVSGMAIHLDGSSE